MRKFKLRNIIVSGVLMIAVSLLSSSLYAQDVGTPVRGNVRDSSNNPIVGASVVNTKTGKGTSTDKSGNFTIMAVKGQTLQISYIGFQPVRVVYRGQAEISVRLMMNENPNMTDVVVIGYGTQRKEAVTGSVASIAGNNLREVPAPNISDALQGRLPGVAISQTSSQPGATMQIRIRGTRSLTATNDPLIVLDGIPYPGSIGDLDMNDVKSVDVLKDASATAIYGSRGANGVILITTYKGSSGQEPRITANG
jgi:TonB-dependent SusC/RagA subfamily outer membrane receptor